MVHRGSSVNRTAVKRDSRDSIDEMNLIRAQLLLARPVAYIAVSASQHIVKALARRAGFPEERVLGIELQLQGGRYTDRVVEPAPIDDGKLEIFLDTVGRSPVLAIGDSMTDFDLLENCEGVSIAIDNGDEYLLNAAREHNWFVQGQLTI